MGPNPKNADDAGKHQKDYDHRQKSTHSDATTGSIIAFFCKIRERDLALYFMGEGLHSLHRAKRFRCIPRRGRDPVLVLTAKDAQAAPQEQDRNDHRRHQQKNKTRQLGRCEQHQRQTTKEDKHIAQSNRDRRADDRKNERCICCDPAQNFACHDILVKRRAERDHAIKDSFANVGNHPFTQSRHQRISQRRSNREQSCDTDSRAKILIEQATCCRLKIINNAAHGQRQDQRHTCRQRKRAPRKEDQHLIRRKEWPKTLERPYFLGLSALCFAYVRRRLAGLSGRIRGHQVSLQSEFRALKGPHASGQERHKRTAMLSMLFF